MSGTCEQHTPLEFAEVLGGPERPLIVGGQAVNIWAEIYSAAQPALDKYAPFTSRDADIHGTRSMAETLARRTGWKLTIFNDQNSIVVASLSKELPGKPALEIEVLNEVNGLKDQDLALSRDIEFEPGIAYRIPTPLVLLKAKLYNLISLGGLDRPQDLKHVKMLAEIGPLYFNELLVDWRAGLISSENIAGAIYYASSIVNSDIAAAAGRMYHFDGSTIIPDSLRYSDNETIRNAVTAFFQSSLQADVSAATSMDFCENSGEDERVGPKP